MIKYYTCTSKEGTLRGLLRIPDNISAKIPIIIMSHGFNSNYSYFDYIANKLLENNVASLAFDFCGGGEFVRSDGSIHDSSVLTQVDDLDAVIADIRTLDIVDGDEIYLLGHSQGGLVASLSAPNNDVCGLFLLAPAYNIPEVMGRLNPPRKGELFLHPIGYMSRKYILDARKIKIYDNVKNFSNEVYIFHGQNDFLVPLDYSINAAKHYRHAHLHILENETHTFTLEGQNRVIREIIKIINGELK